MSVPPGFAPGRPGAARLLAGDRPAAGYREVTARAGRAGYWLDRKKTARLLKAWGFLRIGRKPHPKAQGKPFDMAASNQLWPADMVRHDNGTQFTSHHHRGVAATLKLKLARTAYRHRTEPRSSSAWSVL
jgi:hypothetical protein